MVSPNHNSAQPTFSPHSCHETCAIIQAERLDMTYYQGDEAVNISMLTRATHTLHGFEPNVCSKLVQVRHCWSLYQWHSVLVVAPVMQYGAGI